jgi:hypothetical protein
MEKLAVQSVPGLCRLQDVGSQDAALCTWWAYAAVEDPSAVFRCCAIYACIEECLLLLSLFNDVIVIIIIIISNACLHYDKARLQTSCGAAMTPTACWTHQLQGRSV